MKKTFLPVWILNMLIVGSLMSSGGAHASVVLQVDISDIANGKLTFIGTGANSQNNDSLTTMCSGISLSNFFTNQSFVDRPYTKASFSATYPEGQVFWDSSPTAGASTLQSSAGTSFSYGWMDTYFFDSSDEHVNNDVHLFGGQYGPTTFDPITFEETSSDQSPVMGFDTGSSAFIGTVTFTGVSFGDIPLIGQVGDVFTGYRDHMDMLPGMPLFDLGYYGEGILIGQYEVVDSSSIPEPSAYASIVGGLALLFGFRRRKSV